MPRITTLTAALLLGVSSISLVTATSSATAAARQLRRQESSPSDSSAYLTELSDFLDGISDDLWEVNKAIHENPELGYKEFGAHDLLTSFLEAREGWNVTRSTHGIETAFAAVFQGAEGGPVVSFNAEYGEPHLQSRGCQARYRRQLLHLLTSRHYKTPCRTSAMPADTT